jgi:UDP-3-O-[3-hydroxymyristoyl] glucosamine N-acyltransferase
MAEPLFLNAARGRPQAVFGPGVAPGAVVHPDARLEQDVTIDPGAVVGPRAEIGRGSVICANAVVGPDVRLGRGSAVGAGATLVNALVGDRVVIHQGARIGQSGVEVEPGESASRAGRVILQDDVVVGANATIDRGSLRDTVVGEGSRIDNLAHIRQDVVIGRRSTISAGAAIAPGARLPDFTIRASGVDTPGRPQRELSS